MFIAIAFIGSVLEFLSSNVGAIMAGVGSAFTAVAGWIGLRYLAPFLKVGERKRYASWIAVIADEVTDALVARYPDKRWLERLDEAVDALAEICGVDQKISKRAVEASLSRKSGQR